MNNIKEIKITYVDNSLFNDNPFKETIRLSSKWISYKIMANCSEKSWDYKDNCFVKKYDDICGIVSKLNLFDDYNDAIVIKTVDYNNNEIKYKIRKSCIDYSNGIENVFLSKIIDMIPNNFLMPKCLFASTPNDIDLKSLRSIVNNIEELMKKEKNGEKVYYSGGIIDAVMGLIEPDFCYDLHYKDASERDEKGWDLSFTELRTLITEMSREIHFDANTVKHFIDNGQLLKWLKRIIQLSDNKEELFSRELLTEEVLSNMDPNKVVAIMYAEGGAMGSPGEFEFIDEDFIVYSNNPGTKNGNYEEPYTMGQFDLSLMFKGFEPVLGFFIDIQDFKINDYPWKYICLGAGNHLYMRRDFYDEIGNRIIDKDYPQRYVKYEKITKRA